jgi:hypothetical protein
MTTGRSRTAVTAICPPRIACATACVTSFAASLNLADLICVTTVDSETPQMSAVSGTCIPKLAA